ncbi:MAG: phosphonate C-P lyase system protein PhnH [Hyphomicrobiales bacterium]|nr:phosphonate C-P lyase system protein PhnH [Hyphomicrobiales bacterium]
MALAPAIDDGARRNQSVFRAVMTAMAHPARIERVGDRDANCPLPDCMGDLAHALCDFETPVWLDSALDRANVADWLRFHTGAPLVRNPALAAFAFVSDPMAVPTLESVALGSDAYPDRSTTVVMVVEVLSNASGVTVIGPGIQGAAQLEIGRARSGLWDERTALQPLFPRGVDFIFVCGDSIAAIPRSAMIEV